jgi:hypothetical protein
VCAESECALRAQVAALETALNVTNICSKQQIEELQFFITSFESNSLHDTQKLLLERSELSSLLESIRSQLDLCKSRALEDRLKLRDELFDIGCLLAAESEKCEILEAKVHSLEEQLSEYKAVRSTGVQH